MQRSLFAALGLALAAAGCQALSAGPRGGPDVLYVATPEEVGVEMLRVVGVTSRDVVYDLGSGDGRLVIAAARDFGARGVGVEIDPVLVQESTEGARRAGVAERARFLWQDLFATDITEATVVTLYLRDDVNLKLRPKLLRELRPGTRVISHDFAMGDWRPERVLRVRGPDREHTLYAWRIPAEVAGEWRLTLRGPAGARQGALALTQRYEEVAGTMSLDGPATTIANGRLAADEITFRAGGRAFTGRVDGDRMRGRTGDGAEWTATRGR